MKIVIAIKTKDTVLIRSIMEIYQVEIKENRIEVLTGNQIKNL